MPHPLMYYKCVFESFIFSFGFNSIDKKHLPFVACLSFDDSSGEMKEKVNEQLHFFDTLPVTIVAHHPTERKRNTQLIFVLGVHKTFRFDSNVCDFDISKRFKMSRLTFLSYGSDNV